MHLVLTGATGYVGKHVLARLLGQGHHVTAIARSNNTKSRARQRVCAALKPLTTRLPRNWRSQLRVIEGDVTAANCGISPAVFDALAGTGIDGFIHCAALTRFEQHLERELFTANTDGTRHAFELHEQLGSPHFHHISTAFVIGKARCERSDTTGSAFNNPYEASKFAAEQYLVTRGAPRSAVSIYRPAVVVGGAVLAEDGTASTVYTFIKAMDFLRECYRRDLAKGGSRFADHGLCETGAGFNMPIRVAANGSAPLHLVAIDTVVDAVMDRLAVRTPSVVIRQLSGDPYPLDACRDEFCEALNVTGPRFVDPSAFESEPRNPVEAHFHRVTRSYAPYLLDPPLLTTGAEAPAHEIDLRALARDFIDEMNGGAGSGDPAPVGAMAIDLQGIRSARDYFDALTRDELARHFLRRHAFVDAAIRFRIHGSEEFDEVIEFSNGRARYATPDCTREVDCCYELSEKLFIECIAGRSDLRNAFFGGKVAVRGNKETALKFGSLLSQYYRDIESHVIEEVAV